MRFSKKPRLQELELEVLLLAGRHEALFVHILQHLQSILRHGRVLCVETDFVGELLNMSKLHPLTLLSALHLLERVFACLPEVVIFASVRVQLIVDDMDDVGTDFFEQDAVVKDGNNGVFPPEEVVTEPQHGHIVEMI